MEPAALRPAARIGRTHKRAVQMGANIHIRQQLDRFRAGSQDARACAISGPPTSPADRAMLDAADWLRRQRAQQLVNFGLIRRLAPGAAARETIATSEPDFPFQIVADAYVSGFPAIAHLRAERPYDILDESFTHPVRRHKHGMVKRFLRDLRASEPERIDSALCLAHYWSDNYWHWLNENLPKALLAEEAGFRGIYLVSAAEFAADSLRLLEIAPARIRVHESGTVRVGRLWVSPRLDGESLVHRLALLGRMRARLLRDIGSPPARTRLYASRNRGALARRIRNEPEFQALIARYGFREYHPAEQAFPRQVADFAACEALIGPHGASFSNELFMPEGALVVGLFAPGYIPSVHTLGAARLLRHRYYPLVSPVAEDPYPYGSDIEANLDLIETTLERELPATPAGGPHG